MRLDVIQLTLCRVWQEVLDSQPQVMVTASWCNCEPPRLYLSRPVNHHGTVRPNGTGGPGPPAKYQGCNKGCQLPSNDCLPISRESTPCNWDMIVLQITSCQNHTPCNKAAWRARWIFPRSITKKVVMGLLRHWGNTLINHIWNQTRTQALKARTSAGSGIHACWRKHRGMHQWPGANLKGSWLGWIASWGSASVDAQLNFHAHTSHTAWSLCIRNGSCCCLCKTLLTEQPSENPCHPLAIRGLEPTATLTWRSPSKPWRYSHLRPTMCCQDRVKRALVYCFIEFQLLLRQATVFLVERDPCFHQLLDEVPGSALRRLHLQLEAFHFSVSQ